MKSNSFNGQLIFLISQPRSGSTLLQLLLAGHPDIATTSEPWVALHPIYALRDKGIETEYDSTLAKRALHEFLRQSGMGEDFYEKQVAKFLDSLYKHAMEHQKACYFLDKTPRYYYIIPELLRLFPRAKFIFLFRNPLSVLNSILKTWIKDDVARLAYHKDDLIVAPQKMVDCIKKFADRIIIVKYEELVKESEMVLRAICQFIGVSYSDKMLYYGAEHSRWEFGDQVGVRKDSMPNDKSSEMWKYELLETPQKRLLAHSYLKALNAEFVTKMGYDYNYLLSKVGTSVDIVEGGLMSWSDALDGNTQMMGKNELKAELYAIRNSLTWRITKPLRTIIDFFKDMK